jgi:hypothetical protein
MKNIIKLILISILCSLVSVIFADDSVVSTQKTSGFVSPLPDRELLVFDIRYGVFTAGEATLSLERIEHSGNDAWRIQVNARTNNFYDKLFMVRDFIESIASYENFYSYRFTKRLHEGNYRQHRVHQNFLDQGISIYSRWSYSQNRWNEERMEIPSNTLDIISAFYYVRTQELHVGRDIVLNVTADGKNYDARIRVLRKETIDTIFGKRSCFVIRPELRGDAIFKQTANIDIWLVDDAHLTPVQLSSKVTFGSFRAVLKRVD